ncbi:hypothetical protein C9374_004770 [Naegleria lovaniensis]|uniref:Uncharacterized protein n=1 Tax=Naegleria lovaniensis TaxID=51637 RepID=A0AA88KKB8_NAELO|nr:uncharacterized protein C9374_004770 [Naegleria lovaniensis]KAG2382803.1 hypothetical protein C9374_004770 [Naegleria lovaniensis]
MAVVDKEGARSAQELRENSKRKKQSDLESDSVASCISAAEDSTAQSHTKKRKFMENVTQQSSPQPPLQITTTAYPTFNEGEWIEKFKKAIRNDKKSRDDTMQHSNSVLLGLLNLTNEMERTKKEIEQQKNELEQKKNVLEQQKNKLEENTKALDDYLCD